MGWRFWSHSRDAGGERQRLIDRKHAVATEIRQLRHDAQALRRRGASAEAIEARIRGLQSEHYRLRMAIDRTS
jgi:hypothetical protein